MKKEIKKHTWMNCITVYIQGEKKIFMLTLSNNGQYQQLLKYYVHNCSQFSDVGSWSHAGKQSFISVLF